MQRIKCIRMFINFWQSEAGEDVAPTITNPMCKSPAANSGLIGKMSQNSS